MSLSRDFFKVVFTDAFIFSEDPERILQTTNLSAAERLLARRVWESDLYSETSLEACESLAEELSDVYHWQDNSEGALILHQRSFSCCVSKSAM